MTGEQMNVTVICGSLRKESYNRKLLDLMKAEFPEHWEVEEAFLHHIPLYHADVEEVGTPEAVVKLKLAMMRADGVIIVTPEYNNGMPGVVKNALDWASSPPAHSALTHRAFALAGATPGSGGTALSQYQVRQTLTAAEAYVMPGPKMLVAGVAKKTNKDSGMLEDEKITRHVRKFVEAFDSWMHRF
ncbi:hypothetical protein CHL76_06615 [Marinococcus halophilus]|nr:hypothetical protein CHL76_06615 [Marinococcus halophilus]